MIVVDRKLIENLAVLAALTVVVGGCFLILLPFASALLWAGIFVFSTRHGYGRVHHWLGGRHWLAASLFMLVIISVILLPLLYAILSFGHIVSDFAITLSDHLQQGAIPPLPDWIVQTPLIGPKLSQWWEKLTQANDPAVKAQVNTAVIWLLKGLLKLGVIIGQGFAMLMMSCFIALFFYAGLPTVTRWLQTAVERVSGSRAEQMLDIAAKTIQGVIFGIIGTAIIQGFLTGFGLWLAGVPYAAALTFLAMVLALFPFGTFLIWGPASLWLYHGGDITWMWFLLVWGVGIVGLADNFIKPLVIGRNSNLPFVLIFLGILGGVLQFGALGIFLGPTLLSMGFALSKEWLMGIDQQNPIP
jgi:predicted PurR-regulated permease PerM